MVGSQAWSAFYANPVLMFRQPQWDADRPRKLGYPSHTTDDNHGHPRASIIFQGQTDPAISAVALQPWAPLLSTGDGVSRTG